MVDAIAGFDIGGTKVALVVADAKGSTLLRVLEATDVSSTMIEITAHQAIYYGLSEQLVRMLTRAENQLGDLRIRSIGIVSAGPIRDGGLWNPPNIVPTQCAGSEQTLQRWIPLVEPLRQAFECPVDLHNDCNGAVLGEVCFGIGRDVEDKSMLHLAYATISTGFGVGAWDGGHLIHGKDGNAGELGHILARKNGRLCGCGHLGCVEAYCSGTGIVSNARARLRELADVERGASRFHRLAIADDAHVRSSDLTIEEVLGSITPARVFAAAAEGDPLAQSVISDAIFAAGVALAAIACAYDPEFITLGGGIALSHPELLGPIAEEMRAHINVRAPNVVITPLGAKVTECGAIAIAQRLLDG